MTFVQLNQKLHGNSTHNYSYRLLYRDASLDVGIHILYQCARNERCS